MDAIGEQQLKQVKLTATLELNILSKVPMLILYVTSRAISNMGRHCESQVCKSYLSQYTYLPTTEDLSKIQWALTDLWLCRKIYLPSEERPRAPLDDIVENIKNKRLNFKRHLQYDGK